MKSRKGNSEGTAVYEVGYLILPSIPEDKLSVVIDSMREIITKEGGIEIDAEAPFKQDLEYSMSKTIGASRYVLTDAYLGWIKFELPSKEEGAEHPIEVIKKKIEKMEEVLRFLLVKAPRETTFTFAKAREAEQDVKEEPLSSPVEEVVVE